mmetsp:Transcript_2305/g.3533  ORF Transcript_2305/g.3533 Transcript_2305/m.3533 type:complete len:584 (+) Transcript_2305:61-1812(+)
MLSMNTTLCLLALFSISQSRVITIEEFGGKPDSQISTDNEPIHHPEFLHSSLKNNPSPYDLSRIKHHRAKANDDDLIEQAVENTNAYNLALKAAYPGDRILLLENESYTFIGGIQGINLRNIVLDFAGYTRFIYDLDNWPTRSYTGGSQDKKETEFVPAIDILDCSGIIITCSSKNKPIVSVDWEKNEIYIEPESGSGGMIDGHGKKWWDSAILGDIEVESRPRLIDVRGSMNITVEYVTLVNSPYWTLTLEAIGGEVHHVNVMVDRNYQRQLINNTMVDYFWKERESLNRRGDGDYVQEARQLRKGKPSLNFHFPDILPDWVLQPQNLNTDGIDPIGQDIYIHDCIVLNDDDSVAVKPPRNGRHGSVMNGTIPYKCTSNITIENMVLTGFGASVGSVGAMDSHPCVDNVRFKNIKMPGTGKGIYIKSNKSNCNGNVSSSITNIVYDDVYIKQPVWWPIWIGPQQQHEPHNALGGDCALDYPIGSITCPTQGCSTFENITLRNIVIEDPLLSPGVILGNSSNPMKNIAFENVTMTVPYKYYLTHGRLPFHTKWFPFTGRYKCQHTQGTCKDCNPVPDCFEVLK